MAKELMMTIACIAMLLGGCKDCDKKEARTADGDETGQAGAPETASTQDEKQTEPAGPSTAPPAQKVWTRSGKQPDDDALLQALGSDEQPGEAVLVGEGADMGDGRFFRLATKGPRILALLVSENEGQAQVEAKVPLPVEMLSTREGPVELEEIEMEDLEGDEEKELLLTVSYHTHPGGSGGGTKREQLFVVDLEPVVRVAFTVLTDVEPVEGAGAVTHADIELKDEDGDGHADIVLTGKQCIASACEPMDVTYFYNPASDSWAEKI